MRITIALRDRFTADGRITELGTVGQSRGGGRNSEIPNDVTGTATLSMPATLRPEVDCIVYVEGDAVIEMDPAMSIEDFAAANPGKYLVVVVGLSP